MSGMTKSERDNLAKLARQRAKLAKSLVAEREKTLRAEIEDQLAAQQSVDDELWRLATEEAREAVVAANAHIAEVCTKLGIAEGLEPKLQIAWHSRGENTFAGRRAELRKLAEARIAAAGQSARTTIDTKLLDVETALIAPMLTSEQAQQFLTSMPSADALMPNVDLQQIGAERAAWNPPDGLAGSVLSPRGASSLDGARKALAALMDRHGPGVEGEVEA